MEKPSGDSVTIKNLPFTPFFHTFKKDSPYNAPTLVLQEIVWFA